MRNLVTLFLYIALFTVAVAAVSAQDLEVTIVTATPVFTAEATEAATALPTQEAGNGTITEGGDTNITFELPAGDPPVDDETILNGSYWLYGLATLLFGAWMIFRERNSANRTDKLVGAIENLNSRTVSALETAHDNASDTARQAFDTVHSIVQLVAGMNIPGIDAVVEAVEDQFEEIGDGVPVEDKPARLQPRDLAPDEVLEEGELPEGARITRSERIQFDANGHPVVVGGNVPVAE